FNAASAKVEITGVSVHPGSSKNAMINAGLVAMEFNALLPGGDIPRLTEGYEGFFHLHDMHGDVSHAELHYIVRDHSMKTFEVRKEILRHAAKTINERYGREVVALTIQDTYYNMAEKIAPHMELIENAKLAAKKAGMEPFVEPVRGGTDGCKLSFMGLPTPNICTGGFAYHGKFEHIAMESMDRCAKMVEYLMTGEL
ncbi:MAG: peptidase dimerization domain-containing protein, partial [Clostridia bacterium]|nr:peptidase dimerization domain-containing protein [Clostridia bacterium]